MGTISVWSSVTMGPVGQKILTVARLLAAPLPYNYCVTSGTDGDHGAVSHHYGLSYAGSPTAALDFGCWYAGRDDAAARGRALAKAFYAHSDQTVELIVSGVGSGLNSAGGYYVKNQSRVAPYAVADHYNHIHYASSSEMLDEILARLGATEPDRLFADLDLG